MGFEAAFRHCGMAVYTGDLPPRQEALLGARGAHSGALPRGTVGARLLQPGSPLLLDRDPALHPHHLLLVGRYARPSLPSGTAGQRRRPLRHLRRTLCLPALLRAAPGRVAGRHTGRPRLRCAAEGDVPLCTCGPRLPAVAAEHAPSVPSGRAGRRPTPGILPDYFQFLFGRSGLLSLAAWTLLCFLLIRGWDDLRRRRKGRGIPPGLLLVAWALGPFVVAYIASQSTFLSLTDENLLVSLPAVYLLLARSTTR